MSFTYSFCDGSNDAIDFPRALIADTQATGHVWEDSEILGFTRLQAFQYQSSQTFSAPAGSNLPSTPVPYLRVAALLLDAAASNEAKLSATTALLDWKGDRTKAAAALHAQAKALRDLDDEGGAFAIIEQVHTVWSFQDRFWKMVQRQSA
jgi:hypothetical protein